MNDWKTIYQGDIGMRHVRVEKGPSAALRARTVVTGTAIEVEIDADTPGQLKERLIEDGEFTESQANEIISKILAY